jgi:hypothetical protein
LTAEVFRISDDALEQATQALKAAHHRERVARAAAIIRAAAAEAAANDRSGLAAYSSTFAGNGAK